MDAPALSSRCGTATPAILALLGVVALALGLFTFLQTPGVDAPVGEGPADPVTAAVTFAADVAPILHENCVGCHHAAGSAPFSLVDFEDARRRADTIAAVTRSRRMPPWLPDSDGSTFVAERHLTDHQIQVLHAWAEQGAPLGDSASVPVPPELQGAWRLGEPDLIVRAPTYRLHAEGRDVYRNLVVELPISETRWVEAVELRPGDSRVVHHARMMVDSTSSSAELDAEDEEPGFDGMDLISNATNPDGHFLGWTPGKFQLPPLEDMAWRLEPGTDLVLQLHMRTTGREEVVDAEVGFYFADAPPSQAPVLLLVSSLEIDLPPGAADVRVTNSYELPVDVDVLSVYPHAHYLGKDLRGYATLPDGTIRKLIRIPQWDFNWQDEYRFQEPVFLPSGSVITMDFSFDNSAGNPHQPSDPPRHVTYGSNSMDEMADLIVQVLPRSPEDRERLVADSRWQNAVEDMDYMAQRAYERGTASLGSGDLEAAAGHFQEVLGYRLDHVEALVGLATVFVERGDAASAVLVAERAAEVSQHRDASALWVLARAYGLAQDARAAQTAEAAQTLAQGQGRTLLADSIRAWRSRR